VHRRTALAQRAQDLEGHPLEAEDRHHVAERRDDAWMFIRGERCVAPFDHPFGPPSNAFSGRFEREPRQHVAAGVARDDAAAGGFTHARQRVGETVDVAHREDRARGIVIDQVRCAPDAIGDDAGRSAGKRLVDGESPAFGLAGQRHAVGGRIERRQLALVQEAAEHRSHAELFRHRPRLGHQRSGTRGRNNHA